MAVLKQIKIGGLAHDIAKTVVNGTGVVSVTNTKDFSNEKTEGKDYSYDIDVNVDNSTIKKSEGKLTVGTVPAEKVSVANGAGLTATNAQAAFKELKDGINAVGGAAKSYKIVATEPASNNTLAEYKLQVAEGTSETYADVTGSANIVVPKDQHLKDVVLVNQRPAEEGESGPVSGNFLKFTYVLNNGTESDVYVDVSAFLSESEFGDGLQVSSAGVVSVKIDETSESFLTVSKAGVKLAGVQDAINTAVSTAVEGLDFSDTVDAGQYVSSVSETNGIVSITKANVSDAVLNGYAKGDKPTSTAIDATDNVKSALAKLEHQVDAAKAAATTKVIEGTDAGNNLSIVTGNNADGSVTYTVNLTDVASKKALDAEIAARKAVDGQDGQTYAANSGTNYISKATSLNDADVKLDTALKAEADRAKRAETSIDSVVGLTKAADGETRTYTNEGNYIGKAETKTVASDIKALDTQLKDVTDKLAAVQYKVNGTTLEFFGISENKTA